jgi:hypothetical protein
MQIDHRLPQRAALMLMVCAAAGMSANAAEPEWTWNAKIGYDRNDGKYGTPLNSHDTSTTLTLGLDSDTYGFDLVLPYVAQTGPGRRIALAGRRVVVLVQPGRTAMGMGDVTLGATRYLLNEEASGFDLDVGGTIKFGTASASKGLGTGKSDYAIQTSIGKSAGPVSFTTTAGYTFVGKEADQGYKNSAFATFDAYWKWNSTFGVGATYSYGGPGSEGSSSSRDVTLYASYRFTKQHKIELSYTEGHSPQSPDRGVSATFSCNF